MIREYWHKLMLFLSPSNQTAGATSQATNLCCLPIFTSIPTIPDVRKPDHESFQDSPVKNIDTNTIGRP